MSKAKKPVTERRFQGVIMPTASHPEIRRVRRQGTYPTIHGNKLWKSTVLLMDYLKKHPPDRARTVIDVGCGWGAAGIWCAKYIGSDVTSMDADPDVFPFLDVATQINGVATTPLVSRFERLTTRQLSEFDMLIGADICFWDELVNPVFNMVNRAVNAGVERILIADPRRPTFQEMAARAVERHGGEVIEWETRTPIKANGVILNIPAQ